MCACKRKVSGSFSLPFRGSFHLSFTVLLHYRSPSVFRLGGWAPLIRCRFLVSALTLDTAWYVSCFTYKIITFFDVPSHALRLHLHVLIAVQTSKVFLLLIWPASLSLATTRKISVDFFSSAYLDVSVRQVPRIHLCIQCTLTGYESVGFPHSDIHGSRLICSSPQLIAAYHVLRRLPVPRHSPCALYSLTML